MKSKLIILNKVANIFGIALLMLGFVPVPGISTVSGVYADITTDSSRSEFLPEFTSYAGLLGDLSSATDSNVFTPANTRIAENLLASPVLSCEGDSCTPEITSQEEPAPDAADPLLEDEPVENPVQNAEETITEDPGNTESDVQSEVNALAEAGAVLLDENDQPIPLTSEEALQALSVADPYFTNGGVKYCFVPSGTCAGSCDVCTVSATPIQDAINAADPGTTIYMEQGAEFTESFIINKSITLTADGANAPVIKSSNGTYIVKIENADNVSIFDLKLDGQGDSDVIGVWIVNSGDVWLEGNEIIDTAVGVQIDNPTNATKQVRIYKNTIESDTTGSVGIKINTIGTGSLFASLNTIQNEQYNVLDNSGQSDFELYFNDWGYVDGGGNYQICSMTGHTISDWTQLYNCAMLANVLNSEAFLDGSLYPDVFDQGFEANGGLCIAEKNATYAVKLDKPISGTISLNAGETLGAIGIKSSTDCFYSLAPVTVGESVTVNGEDGGACYQVTLSEDNEGNLEYYFEKIGSGRGCKDISHMVGYYADPTEEEPEGYCGDGIVQRGEECEPGGNGPCTEECIIPTLNLQLTSMCWEDETSHKFRVRNPNDFPVDFTIHGAGSGGGTAAPGDSFFYITGSYGSANTTIIKWYDHNGDQKQTVKAVNQNFCEEQLQALQLSLVCLGEGQFSWQVSNPNNVAVNDVQVRVNGNLVYEGSISALAQIGNTLFSGITTSHTMQVTWEGNGSASTETDVCEGGEFRDLQPNLACLGVGQFAWSLTNPNNFEVQNVQVLIDGSLVFDGSLAANATVGLGMTGDGPATHTMVVTWEEEGSAFLESNMVCESTFTPPPQDPPIPVTGLQFIIPVTGLDLTSAVLALRAAIAAGGFSILAFSYAIGKRNRED